MVDGKMRANDGKGLDCKSQAEKGGSTQEIKFGGSADKKQWVN